VANVQLRDGKTLNVNESIGDIETAVNGKGAVLTPMIRLTEVGSERPVLAFASQILFARDQPSNTA
jgi:hypothetical protein